MTYTEFIEKIRIKAHEELNYPLEMMEFFPEGYTSNNPKMVEWIIDSNARFAGGDPSPWLKTDFLVLKRDEGIKVEDGKDSVATMQRIAIRKLYQEVQTGQAGSQDNADDNKTGENGNSAAADNAAANTTTDAKAVSDDAMIEKAFAKLKQMHDATIGTYPEALNLRASGDYAKIKEHLILRPLNYELHEFELFDCVYKKINDFVLVLYQLIGVKEEPQQNGKMTHFTSSKIKRSELKRWGISEEEVLDEALKNTARLFPPCIFNKKTGKEANFLEEKGLTKKDIIAPFFPVECILLSTFTTTNGAIALFYPGVIEKMMKIMGGSFAAVFMNINDVMICDKGSPFVDSFKATAKEAKSPLGEILSKSAYVCDKKGLTPLR